MTQLFTQTDAGEKHLAEDHASGGPLPLTVSQAAKLLGLSRSAAYRAAGCGDLPVIRLGGRIYVVRERLQALFTSA